MTNQFKIKKDKDGRTYYTGYANKTTNAVISLNDVNLIVEGNPKINIRDGDSRYGEELIIELLRTGSVIQTPKKSNYDSIEIYFPKNEGLQLIERFIDFYKGRDNY